MTSGPDVWRKIFSSEGVIEKVDSEGVFSISSKRLNSVSKELGGPDARNLVKYDHRQNLPPAFQSENLSILPVANGEFQIGRFEVYSELKEDASQGQPEKKPLPSNLETIQQTTIRSETDSILAANYSGMIEAFLGAPAALVSWGRRGGPDFSFSVETREGKSHSISVRRGVTIEIDAQFEGSDFIAAIEAKRVPALDFHVRQLYYPFRALQELHSKKIRTIFLTYTSGVFEFREYKFLDWTNISSFQETRRQSYSLNDDSPTLKELVTLAQTISPKPAHLSLGGTFPQADRFDRVVALVETLLEGPRDKSAIAEEFGFDQRQSDYYAKAAEFLGLSERASPGVWRATQLAQEVFGQHGQRRSIKLAELVLQQPSFNTAFQEFALGGQALSRERLQTILVSTGGADGISGQTVGRRVGTLGGWVSWLGSLTRS